MVPDRISPIDVTVAGVSDDPREQQDPPDVVVHRVPMLHPDDVTTVGGIRVTSPARTLIDLAEVLDQGTLRQAFRAARARGLLDMDAVAASRARVEWRPSLSMLDAVIADFRPGAG